MAFEHRNLKNNWSTTLQADAAAAATTLSLPQPWIDKLTSPNPSATEWYMLTLDDGVQAPEIVRCTGKGTGTVTVVRQQEGTVAPPTWAAGTKVEIRATAELLRPLEISTFDPSVNALAIGPGAGANAYDNSTFLGYRTGTNEAFLDRTICIGHEAVAYTPRACVLGSESAGLTDVYIGSGQRAASPDFYQVTLHATCGYGADSTGVSLRLAGGSGTGTGDGGKVYIATAAAGPSGSDENLLTDRAEWDTAGLFWTYGAIKTGNPGAGAGTWKLGTVQAGAVTLDTANYVEVDIGGTVVKLLKAA